MTLALLTRGYICPGRGPSVFGPGPGIVGIQLLSPDIRASGEDLGNIPVITGAGEQVPQPSGAAIASAPPIGETPQIVGGTVMSPNIKSSG
jgi:hypothetical protein